MDLAVVGDECGVAVVLVEVDVYGRPGDAIRAEVAGPEEELDALEVREVKDTEAKLR